ncbi:MAG TPA: phosphate-starvation-inducible PsiE family protein [Chloroflexota bacterium]|nr:phosphate-starvation-inducible PsiE family protein [Chloroflexota bacterium]
MRSTDQHGRLERRLEGAGHTWGRWLDLGENTVLLGVGTVLLLAGLAVVLVTVRELLHALAFRTFSEDVIEIAESAMLALILAELVHTVLLPLRGRALTPDPFLVIAVVAIARDILLTSILIPKSLEAGTLLTAPMAALVL